VRVGEFHTARREPVEMWRGDFSRGIETAHIPDAEVVGEDEDDVRPIRSESRRHESQEDEEDTHGGKNEIAAPKCKLLQRRIPLARSRHFGR
jgi:hypothetical protein